MYEGHPPVLHRIDFTPLRPSPFFHFLTFKHLHLFLDFLLLLCFPYPSTLPTFSPLFISLYRFSLYRFLLTYLSRLFSPSLSPLRPSPFFLLLEDLPLVKHASQRLLPLHSDTCLYCHRPNVPKVL